MSLLYEISCIRPENVALPSPVSRNSVYPFPSARLSGPPAESVLYHGTPYFVFLVGFVRAHGTAVWHFPQHRERMPPYLCGYSDTTLVTRKSLHAI